MDLVVVVLDNLQVLLLLHVGLMKLSLVFLLRLGDLVESRLDDCVDLSSDVALSKVVLFEVVEKSRLLRRVAFEKSEHF